MGFTTSFVSRSTAGNTQVNIERTKRLVGVEIAQAYEGSANALTRAQVNLGIITNVQGSGGTGVLGECIGGGASDSGRIYIPLDIMVQEGERVSFVVNFVTGTPTTYRGAMVLYFQDV
jgi:hypothetical protein